MDSPWLAGGCPSPALSAVTDTGGSSSDKGAKEFKVVVSQTSRQKLGLTMRFVDGATLHILVVASDGLVQQWNENHPGRTVKPGHFIVEVNGMRNNARLMLDECWQDKTLELVFKRFQEVTPSEEAELKRLTFRAVVRNNTYWLRTCLLPRLPWDVWSRWRNAASLDLLDLSQESGSQDAGALLSKAWKWREVAWASVRDWACMHSLVTKGDAFPRHCLSCNVEGYMKLLDEQLKEGQATLD